MLKVIRATTVANRTLPAPPEHLPTQGHRPHVLANKCIGDCHTHLHDEAGLVFRNWTRFSSLQISGLGYGALNERKSFLKLTQNEPCEIWFRAALSLASA